MGRRTKFRDLIGLIKDTASQSKAALSSNATTVYLIRATSHDAVEPPNNKHIAAVLSHGGNGSRATAAEFITVLMERLQRTHDSCVAIKCLITVHHIIKHGSFILQDQLSVYPAAGGRNYLNLSNFRDCSSTSSWELSSWIRWYAQYLEQLLSTSRDLGFFLSSSSCTTERCNQEEKIAAMMNRDLVREIDSIAQLIAQLCSITNCMDLEGNMLVEEVMNLVSEDYLSAINEASLRVDEFRERTSCLSFGESIELVCTLKRLEDCKEKLSVLFVIKKTVIEAFWSSIADMKEKIGAGKVFREERRMVAAVRREKMSESARYSNVHGGWYRLDQ